LSIPALFSFSYFSGRISRFAHSQLQTMILLSLGLLCTWDHRCVPLCRLMNWEGDFFDCTVLKLWSSWPLPPT
jgi:hypothetical protein